MIDTEKVRALRSKLKLSQAAAAEKSDLRGGRQAWNNVEKGRLKNPTTNTLEKVASALGVGIKDILK